MVKLAGSNRRGTLLVRTSRGRLVPFSSWEALQKNRGDTMFGPNGRYQRCGAKSKRTGHLCKNPVVKGSTRCRMHGGITAERARSKIPSERVARNRAAAEERKWRPRFEPLAAEVRSEFDTELRERIRSVWRRGPEASPPGSATSAWRASGRPQGSCGTVRGAPRPTGRWQHRLRPSIPGSTRGGEMGR